MNRTLACLGIALLGVVGCNGGGGSSTGSVVTGGAAKGRFLSGFAQAYRLDLSRSNPQRPRGSALSRRTPLAIAASESRFALSILPGYAGPVLVEIDGVYLDEVRGVTATIPPENPLRGAGFTDGSNALVNVTALNHLALAEAVRLANGQDGAFAAALSQANGRIARQFGVRVADLLSADSANATSRALRAIATTGRRLSGGADSAFNVVQLLARRTSGPDLQTNTPAPAGSPATVVNDLGRQLSSSLPPVVRIASARVEPGVAGRGGVVELQVQIANYGGVPATLNGLTAASSPPYVALSLTPALTGPLTLDPFESPRVFTFRGVVSPQAAGGPVDLSVAASAVSTDGSDASDEEPAVATLDLAAVVQQDLPVLSFGSVIPSTDTVRAGESVAVTVGVTNAGLSVVELTTATAQIFGSQGFPGPFLFPVNAPNASLPAIIRGPVRLQPGDTAAVVVDVSIPPATSGFRVATISISFGARDARSGATLQFETPPQFLTIVPRPAQLSISSVRLTTSAVGSPGELILEMEFQDAGGSAILYPYVSVIADRPGIQEAPAEYLYRVDPSPRISSTYLIVGPNVPPGPVHLTVSVFGTDEYFLSPVTATLATSPAFTVLPSPPRAVLTPPASQPIANQAVPGTIGMPIRFQLENLGPVAATQLQIAGRAYALTSSDQTVPRSLAVRAAPTNSGEFSALASGTLELQVDLPDDLPRSIGVVVPDVRYFDGVEAQRIPFFGVPTFFRVNPRAHDPAAHLSLSALTVSTGIFQGGITTATVGVRIANDGGQDAISLNPVLLPDGLYLDNSLPTRVVPAGQSVDLEFAVRLYSAPQTLRTTLSVGFTFDDGVSNPPASTASIERPIDVIASPPIVLSPGSVPGSKARRPPFARSR
ncbi:MAG: hypothetical protein HY303_17270 [Candidatus Wallbacteria bacterium]|nr:hypothetical protein [Candidatus Wallbacteria bacterium]